MNNWNDSQTADTQPGNYYVTATDGASTYPLAGPFVNDHAAALAAVRDVMTEAGRIDGRACFMAWGTTRCGADYVKPGKLNHVAGLTHA